MIQPETELFKAFTNILCSQFENIFCVGKADVPVRVVALCIPDFAVSSWLLRRKATDINNETTSNLWLKI